MFVSSHIFLRFPVDIIIVSAYVCHDLNECFNGKLLFVGVEEAK